MSDLGKNGYAMLLWAHANGDRTASGVTIHFAKLDNRTGAIWTGSCKVEALYAQEDANEWNGAAAHHVVVPTDAPYDAAELYVDGDFVVRRKADNARADLVDEDAPPDVIKPFEAMQ